jgi:hypothetical protein
MTRYRLGAGFSSRDAAVPGRVGAHQARPARRRTMRFQFERLEERLAMDGDGTLVADATADDAVVVALPGMTAANDAPAMPVDDISERFESAAELEAWLIEAATAQYGHLFGQSTFYGYPYRWYQDFDLGRPIVWRTEFLTNDAVSGGMVLMAGNLSSSTTNVQVAGVDEADLIETDGEYLYILSGNELVIVQAGVGEDLQELSRIRIGGQPVGMYLDGDRLAIVSSNADYNYSNSMVFRLADDYRNFNYAEPTTTVTVLDVGDRSAPQLVQKSEMDGRLVASRVVDGGLRLVLSNELKLPQPIAKPLVGAATVPAPSKAPTLGIKPIESSLILATDAITLINFWNPTPVVESVYETLEEYVARVKDEILSSATPSVRVLGLDGEVISESSLVAATDIYRPESAQDRSLTTVATFDLSSNTAGPADTKSVFTRGTANVYATSESLYLFSQHWDYSVINGVTTAIHKFDFDAENHEISLSARGSVEGSLLNQFAADEHEGYLRVVTGSASWDGGQSVFVLKQMSRRLEVVGKIDGIAPTEDIYSVRFMGDRAFLVTFRKVDPLFALDLSDPTDPKILGELKIPGYSDYLQPIDENHLLAIGRGADEASGLFQELQVSIFNIADMENPELAHRYSFEGGRAITTPATGDRWQRGDGDHHAVSYFAEAGVFALPIANSDGDWWWDGVDPESSGLESGEGGLQVFQIDVTTGFTPIGLIKHETEIQRSLRIGEHLYAISSGRVSVHELTDPNNELGTLSIVGISPPLYTRVTMLEMESGGATTTLAAPVELEPEVEPVVEPEFEPYSGPFVGPLPQEIEFEAAIDVTAAIEVTMVGPLAPFQARSAALVEDSLAAADRPASEVAATVPLPEAIRSRTSTRVQRLARMDAFESVDSLLLLADEANELAMAQASVGRSAKSEVSVIGDDELSAWDTLGSASAASGELELAF